MTAPVTVSWNAPDPSTCEHPRMVDGVYRITATPLGVNRETVVTENPARQCARCGWVDGRVPGFRVSSPGVPHQILVSFAPTPKGPTMTDQTPDPRLIPNGHTLHWILDPGFDHGDLRIRYVDLRIATDTSPLDRRTGITVRGPRIVSDGVVTRGHFAKSAMLGALPEHLREQIIEAVKAARKPIVRHRDAATGEFVTAEEAAERPDTTIRETRNHD